MGSGAGIGTNAGAGAGRRLERTAECVFGAGLISTGGGKDGARPAGTLWVARAAGAAADAG